MTSETGTASTTSANAPASRIRVIDLETAGNGPTEACEIGWQDVELGADGQWRPNEKRGAIFVNPGRQISPETMAVHHIQDSEVAPASTSLSGQSTVRRALS